MTTDSQPLHISRRAALRTFAFTLGATALPGVGLWTAMGQKVSPSPSPSPASSPAPIISTPLGERLTMITGVGGNIALLAGDDGTLVVDSGIPAAAAKTAAEVAKAGPVGLLVNTHWHYDHVGGNEALAQAGARIIAHQNCRKRMSTEQYVEPVNVKVPASAPTALPRVTFTNETTLHANGDDIRLVPVPPAHTDGDVVVRFEKADLIHAGDLFFHRSYPFIDYSSGGWIGGMVAAAHTIVSLSGPKTRIIPGHGPIATQEELKGYLSFLETMLDRLQKLKSEGKTVDEVVAAGPAREFDEKLGKGFMKPEQFIRIAYQGLLKHG